MASRDRVRPCRRHHAHNLDLGDWDGDEALGIVSRRAPLARAVEGARAGQICVVQLPDPDFDGEFTEEEISIEAVSPLSAEVLAWAR